MFVIITLVDGTVLRLGPELEPDAARFLQRDLDAWLHGSRALDCMDPDGRPYRLSRSDIASIGVGWGGTADEDPPT